jgi:hypothetical protein
MNGSQLLALLGLAIILGSVLLWVVVTAYSFVAGFAG